MSILDDIRAKNKKKKEEAAKKNIVKDNKPKPKAKAKAKPRATGIVKKGPVDKSSFPVDSVKTGGGPSKGGREYAIFKKDSSSAGTFRGAFAAARKARMSGGDSYTYKGKTYPINKKGNFRFNGRQYNSFTADDNKKAAAEKASSKKPVKAKVIPKVVAAKEVTPKVIKPKSEAQVMALRRADDKKNYFSIGRKSGGRICHGTRGYKPYNT
tara:strand:- start:1099 stop:1731 length:633 start_codon:yes stop_codon:yes gene_type:complete